MAKPIDVSKIERIRESAISIISRQGVPNCSVAAIAKQAGVSVGYLYRHYPSKDALINDMLEQYFELINEKISSLIADNRNIEYVVAGVVEHIMAMSEQDEDKSKFLIMLLNDFSVEIDSKMKNRIKNLAEELIVMLKDSTTADKDLTAEDIYFAMIGIPMQYLSQRYSHIVGGLSAGNNSAHVVKVALKMIIK